LSWRKKFVGAVYADHNSSYVVQSTLAQLLDSCSPDAFILNVGAGETRLDPRVKTLEIEAAPGIDFVGSATALPIEDNSLDLLITQEVLEHVDNPFLAMREIYRVMKSGAKAYVQLPFTIGYHPCPNDYWRFTRHGIEELARQAGFCQIETGTSIGPATGAYRIAVEFFAILFSLPLQRSYRLFKGFFAALFYPLKWLDGLMQYHDEADRIAGGYFVVLTK
jgi:SAM-dependent methyltransferase